MNRILVIEDDPDMAQVLATVLRRDFGAEVRVVDNGHEGVERARADAPDLILLDLMLPGVDGLEVLRRIKRTEPVVEAPVVFVTGAPESVFGRRRPQALGACGVITKPIDMRQLCGRIELLLREAGILGIGN